MKNSILVLIPAYNEAQRVGAVITGVKKHLPSADIVVVDDGSEDQTAAAAAAAGAKVIRLPFNLGVGAALQTGYHYATAGNYTFLIQLDADGQHDPTYLPVLLKALEQTGADLLIGSRFLADSYTGSRIRGAGNRFFARLVSFLIGERLTDPTSGYRALRRAVFLFCSQTSFSFEQPDADFLVLLHRKGFKIKEIPITVKPREGGRSQHYGLRPVVYLFRVLLSLFVNMLRKP